MAIKLEPHAEPLPGYRLIERLGGGGFGVVFRVTEGVAPRAIKTLRFQFSSADELKA